MARSIWSLRSKAPARAISALMRSALEVFSPSISGPQLAMILSSSWASAAAKQGAGSIGGEVAGSGPSLAVLCDSAATSTAATAQLWIGDERASRIEPFSRRPGEGRDPYAVSSRFRTPVEGLPVTTKTGGYGSWLSPGRRLEI